MDIEADCGSCDIGKVREAVVVLLEQQGNTILKSTILECIFQTIRHSIVSKKQCDANRTGLSYLYNFDIKLF